MAARNAHFYETYSIYAWIYDLFLSTFNVRKQPFLNDHVPIKETTVFLP